MPTKPPRPFGISLAILTSVLIFALIPLVISVMFLYLNNRVYLDDSVGSFSGLSFLGISTPTILFYTSAAIIFLIMAFLAWRGRPGAMRFIFPISVMVMAILMSLLIFISGTTGRNLQNGIDSAETARQLFRDGYIIILLLVVIYISWFFNRWSARAYYRGYYTPEDQALIKAYQDEITALQK